LISSEYVFDKRFWQSCFLRGLADSVFAVTVSRVGRQAAESKACFVDQQGNACAGGYETSTSRTLQIGRSLKLLDILRKPSNGIFGMLPDFVHKIGF
jgi:hypothetical protein